MPRTANLRYWFACHLFGYCPNNDEIRDKSVKDLSDSLACSSQTETALNILEWQDRNLTFWEERYLLSTLKLLVFAVIAISLLIVFGIYTVGGYRILGLFFEGFSEFTNFIVVKILVSALTIALFFVALFKNNGISILEGFANAHPFVMSFHMSLKRARKFAICRDYAKLAAALLFNYSNKQEIYFLHS